MTMKIQNDFRSVKSCGFWPTAHRQLLIRRIRCPQHVAVVSRVATIIAIRPRILSGLPATPGTTHAMARCYGEGDESNNNTWIENREFGLPGGDSSSGQPGLYFFSRILK
jgi:hypothetical protein